MPLGLWIQGVSERLYGLRNRLLSSPRFQSWAAAFPLTRRTAERHARSLFDLCAGFVYSQVLRACVQLEVFDQLAAGSLATAELAARWRMPLTSAQRLLEAADALKLVARRSDGRYGLGVLGAALRANPGVLAMVEHHAVLYADLADPVALLRAGTGGRLPHFWAYDAAREGEPSTQPDVQAYTRLMAQSQSLIAIDTLDAYPLGDHRRLMDVGGGDGSFAIAAVDRTPGLTAVVADLPAVAALAAANIERHALGKRVAVAACDALRGPLPAGADLVSLVRVLHDHDDAPAQLILERAFAALPENGTLLIAEPMAAADGAGSMVRAYFGIYLLAMGRGRLRTPAELAGMARRAGFAEVRARATRRSLLVQLLTCRKRAGGRKAVAAALLK